MPPIPEPLAVAVKIYQIYIDIHAGVYILRKMVSSKSNLARLVYFRSRPVGGAQGKFNGASRRQSMAMVQPGSEKLPAFVPIEIASRFCPAANFWGTGLPAGCPRRGPNKAFHNPAPCVAAIPGLRANRGPRSSRAVGALWPGLLATSLFSCATFSPANRLNSMEAFSPPATVAGGLENDVFTYTQLVKNTQNFMRVYGRNA